MAKKAKKQRREKWRPPHIGQRILKTTIAVFLCLLVYNIRGYYGQDMPTEAAITAIICMQPYVRDSRDYAINRFAGTLIGAGWGLAFLLLLLLFPVLSRNVVCLYALMALGVMVSLYTAVLIRKPDTSSLAAIVFICVVIAFPEIDQPLQQAVTRILGVLLGTFVAIAVNVFRLPREKHRELVLFARTKDLTADRFSHIPAAALFRLNYLYDDGAKICLMSEHAPAFFTLQMDEAMLGVPLIVMDGAAIYDMKENQYLDTETIAPEETAWLRKRLDELGLSYFIYTVHKNKTCIFHQGEINEKEKVIFDRMRRSPYRSYLEGEIYEEAEIVYFKVIAEDAIIADLETCLQGLLQGHRLRAVARPQSGAPGLSGLYIYSDKATMAEAEKRLMRLLREKDPTLRPVEVFLRDGYRSEHDAMHLLHLLGSYYEPVRLIGRRRKLPQESTDKI